MPFPGTSRATISASQRGLEGREHAGSGGVPSAAEVNYVASYDALKPHNVDGTREMLRFAHTGVKKTFHLISSTFIYGWTVKDVLWERDANPEMENLDFGYAQSKWVAEQLVYAAGKQGLDVRIYRPSLISASEQSAIGSRTTSASGC